MKNSIFNFIPKMEDLYVQKSIILWEINISIVKYVIILNYIVEINKDLFIDMHLKRKVNQKVLNKTKNDLTIIKVKKQKSINKKRNDITITKVKFLKNLNLKKQQKIINNINTNHFRKNIKKKNNLLKNIPQ